MGRTGSREPKVTEAFRGRRGSREGKVTLGPLVTPGRKGQRACEGFQAGSALPEPKAPREKLAVLENQEFQDQMDNMDQRANQEPQGTTAPREFLGRKEKREPREFLDWEDSRDKRDGRGSLEGPEQLDLEGHRASQAHRVHQGEEGDPNSASRDPRAWMGQKEKREKMVLPGRKEPRAIRAFPRKR